MNDFLHEYVFPHFSTFISAVLTGFAGFIFGKRKQNAETETIEANNDSIEIGNADKIISVYRNSLDDLTKRYENKFKEVTELYENKIQLLKDEIAVLKSLNDSYKIKIQELEKRN